LANDITNFAKSANMGGRADALVWNVASNCPRWLKPLPSGERGDHPGPELSFNLAFMKKFVSAAMKKVLELQAGDPDFFYAVGVVNEPITSYGARSVFRDGPLFPRNVPVIGSGVPAYIREAFSEANAANRSWAQRLGVPASRAKLFLNETDCDTDQFGPLQRPALMALLEAMLKEGLPITAVGLECHLQPQMMTDPSRPDWSAFLAFVEAIGALGLDVYLTELDVLDYVASCAGAPATRAASDEVTNLYFGTFLDKVLRSKAVKSICFWDLSDRYAFYRRQDVSGWFGYDRLSRWLPRSWPKCATLPADKTAIACPRPTPYDDAYVAKPARTAVANAIRAAPKR
jgi:endo-1,4-beta-xylanase